MDTRGAVEFVGLAVDLAGVGVIVIAMVVAGVGFARGLIRDGPFDSAYRQLRQAIGRGSRGSLVVLDQTQTDWFVVLLLLGIFNFGILAMITYVITGPDATAEAAPHRAPAPA